MMKPEKEKKLCTNVVIATNISMFESIKSAKDYKHFREDECPLYEVIMINI